MKNITLSVDDATYRKAKIKTAQQQPSASGLVREALRALAAGRQPSREAAAAEKKQRLRLVQLLSQCQIEWPTREGKALRIDYPRSWLSAAGLSAEQFEIEAQMAMAMKLYEMGRLTSGQAARLAGISRAAFLLACPQWNVPTVAFDSAELTGEFKRFPS